MENRTSDNEKKWFAIYTKSRAEKQLFSRLSEKGYDVFLPLITQIRIWSDRKKKVQQPLINSYIFVRIEERSLHQVIRDPGAVGILKYLGKPAVVRDHEIESLKILISGDTDKLENVEERNFEDGEKIEVIKGPFIGLIAEYVRLKGKYRIIVKIASLGSVISVDIPGSYIKKLKT